MKIGFTSRVCPEWDLLTIVRKAAEFGYDGVELGALQGTAHLPAARALTDDPEAVKCLFADHKIELVGLGTGDTLDSWNAHEVAQSRKRVLEVVELAGRLGCPFVRVPIGNVPKGDNRYRALSRVASMFAGLAAPTARHHVTLLVENGGDFVGSDDVWFVVDHAAHPAVAACWNPCRALTRLERPTISIPRLGRALRLVRVCDGVFDRQGRFEGFRVPGAGNVELRRMIDLLRGILYRGYLMFDWPKAAVPELLDADTVLPMVRPLLREWIDTKAEVLAAYKGDKKAVRLNLPDGAGPAPQAAQTVEAAEA